MYFKQIVGQEKIKSQLIQNTLDNCISHAQIFVESEGRGALGMAFAYARYINCENRTENDSCGTCRSCLKFNKLSHPDLHIFFPNAPSKSNKSVSSKTYINQFREAILDSPYLSLSRWYDYIGVEKKHAIINVDDCNEIVRLTSLKTYEAKYKIFIVWMAEKIQYKAAPKLLKAIEEPADNTVFLFVSQDTNQIPETILSRLQVINFPPLDNLEIKKALIEKHECDEETASKISSQAAGNFTEALDQCNLMQPEEIFYLFRDWLRSCFKLTPAEIFNNIEKITSFGREKQKAFLGYGLKIFDKCLLKNYNAGEPSMFFKEENEFLLNFSKLVNHKNVVPITDCFNDAIGNIERNANGKLVFADLSFKMHKLLKSHSN